ncbi:DUF3213 domain-containing protein [Thermococcus sp. CX2]|uniref:DUF3213 domain-containing protein n=1 Tax=Thermococcus sp. CX2 TaxID=163006 RepID=UPI001439CCB2|nr:DUF3213 domain-containing protein [Thermococcus sp. CX2]NJE85327.1 DUF3213 domain-containing protein [Thermococcus sp. CX2]
MNPEKTLTKLDFRFGRITPEEARAKQYELLTDTRIWRAFINGFARNGYVVFDEEKLSREELLERLKELEPEVTGEEHLTVAELIKSSHSWNNLLGKAES